MATRTKPVPMTDQEQDFHAPAVLDDGEDLPETPEDRVYAMLESIGNMDRGKVKVYRTNEKTRDLEYCKEYTAAEFEAGGFDMIRDTFGPGSYELRFWGNHPVSNRFAMLQRQPLTLAAVLATAPTIPRQDNSGMAQVVQTLQTLTQTIVEMRQAPPVDPKAGIKDTLEMMALFKSVMGEPTKNSMSEMVAAFREMREAAKEFTPEQEKSNEDSLIGAMGPILQLVANSRNAQPLPVPQVPANLQALPAPAIPVTDDEKQAEYLKSQLNMMLMAAATNQDTEKFADSFYTLLPDELFAVLHDPKWFDYLGQAEPRCKEFQPWITAVRDHLLHMAEEDALDEAQEKMAQEKMAQELAQKPKPAAMTASKKTVKKTAAKAA